MTDVYSRWKGWTDEDQFAHAKRGDLEYFRAELRVAGLPPAGASVLEVGFGNGEFLDVARRHRCNVTGSELLPDLVEKAQTAGFRAVTPAQFDSLADGSFDLIVAFDVLEHIAPEETIDFLLGLAQKVKPSGAIVLRYPNADSALGNPFQNGDPTHLNAIGWLKLTFYAAEAGLDVVGYRGASRRGFSTSFVHGIHRFTAGVYADIAGRLKRAIYFPALPVVLYNGNVVCTLRRRGG